jgi:hypothetical protein
MIRRHTMGDDDDTATLGDDARRVIGKHNKAASHRAHKCSCTYIYLPRGPPPTFAAPTSNYRACLDSHRVNINGRCPLLAIVPATSIRRRQGKSSRSIRRRARRRAWRWDGTSSSSLLRGVFPTHFAPLLADVPCHRRQCYPDSLRPLRLAVPPAMSLQSRRQPPLCPASAVPCLRC